MSMTQIWSNDKVLAVTPILATPCTIAQVRNKAKDGYEAIQLASGERKKKNINKPQLGHVKNLNITPAHVREFRTSEAANFKVGDVVSVGTFAVGDKINVTAPAKGKGFQGVVKRHGFHGFRKTHGNKDQERMGGSIGPKGPAHVFKGMKMGGRMGGKRITTTNLEIVGLDEENNTLLIKGAVPGAINGFVMITGVGELKVNLKNVNTEAVLENVEELKEESKIETGKKEEVKIEEVEVKIKEVKEEAKTEEVKVEETKVEENKAEEAKLEEVKTNE